MRFAQRMCWAHAGKHALGFALTFAMIAPAAWAQGAGDGFLFATPRGNLTVRASYAGASARSDLFSFTTDQLMLRRRDFSGVGAELEWGFALAARTQLVVASAYSGASKQSEFRRFVDQNNNPIRQTTTFQRVPITVGVRQYLTSPGRGIGAFAWVPAKFVPFLGVSAGAMWYRFRQNGDFIDFNTSEVFPSTLVSSGWTPAVRASAGTEYSLSPKFALTAQGAYLWSNARLSSDFSGFHRIDLSGLSASVGLTVRY